MLSISLIHNEMGSSVFSVQKVAGFFASILSDMLGLSSFFPVSQQVLHSKCISKQCGGYYGLRYLN